MTAAAEQTEVVDWLMEAGGVVCRDLSGVAEGDLSGVAGGEAGSRRRQPRPVGRSGMVGSQAMAPGPGVCLSRLDDPWTHQRALALFTWRMNSRGLMIIAPSAVL